MLSSERLEYYRGLSNSERLALSLRAMRESWPLMFHGSRETVARRFAALRKENDQRNTSILERLQRTIETGDEQHPGS